MTSLTGTEATGAAATICADGVTHHVHTAHDREPKLAVTQKKKEHPSIELMRVSLESHDRSDVRTVTVSQGERHVHLYGTVRTRHHKQLALEATLPHLPAGMALDSGGILVEIKVTKQVDESVPLQLAG